MRHRYSEATSLPLQYLFVQLKQGCIPEFKDGHYRNGRDCLDNDKHSGVEGSMTGIPNETSFSKKRSIESNTRAKGVVQRQGRQDVDHQHNDR